MGIEEEYQGELFIGGTKLSEMGSIELIDMNDSKYECNKKYFFDCKNETTFSIDFTDTYANTIMNYLGIDEARMPDAYEIQYVKFVQKRKHKKKRINKKWAKRYGYISKLCKSKGQILKTNADGTFEFVKR